MAKEYSRSLNGQSIPEAYRGTEIRYQGGETVSEVLALGHAENEAAIVRAFYIAFNIAFNSTVTKMANDGASHAEIASAIAKQVIPAKVSKGGKGNPEALEKARAAQKATKEKASKMDALRAKAETDPELAAKLAELGL